MNTIDSVEHNEALVVIWNTIEEKAIDPNIRLYAKKKRQQLTELRESKRTSDENKKDFDKEYMRLIDKEIKEVQRYAKKVK